MRLQEMPNYRAALDAGRALCYMSGVIAPARVNERGEPPKLTVLEMQEVLEDDLSAVRAKYGLSLEDGARSCALATARLIREGAPEIGLEVACNVAAYGFSEGCKTVPRNLDSAAPRESRSLWSRLWK